MTQENQALHHFFQQVDLARANEIVSELPEEHREHVRDFSFPMMVSNLAKPGEDIVASLTISKFIALLGACASVVTSGNALDRVKKAVVYNKDADSLPAAQAYAIGSSREIGLALEALTPEKAHLLHMALGVAGEAAETLSAVLDHILGGQLDGKNLVEETGDALFYHVGILNALNVSLAEAALHNKVKLLGKRYKNGYSDAAAQARADKPAGE